MTGTAAAELPTSGWTNGPVPPNVKIGPRTLITGPKAFARFRSHQNDALTIGAGCTMDGVHFAINPAGCCIIGDGCAFYGSLLLCELDLRIGNYVFMGWNVVISDSDFHPTEPAERHADVLACSPLGEGMPRRPYVSKSVVIGDDVYIGHNATILKGVTIGAGAFIEPGAVVSHDVPRGARVIGNPAKIVDGEHA
jgi:acetyltransferase-like isoleucine patch superfamily enzyme